MGNLFDYLDWRGDLSLEASPLNEVDSLILSDLSYLDYEGIVPAEQTAPPVSLAQAIRDYLRRHKGEVPYLGKILPPQTVSLAVRAAKSRRFGSLGLSGYVNLVDPEAEMQFSALTFRTYEGKSYLAYRGTDDTLVGWKENFNMSFMQPVPAQLEAVKYLERTAAEVGGELYLGGHSKGGNLAVFAAVKCRPEYQDRIHTVFNNDGPGFDRAFVEGLDYQNMRGKIRTLVPQSSVVGMLLEHEETYEVVQSSAAGLLQHNPLSWDVLGGRFIHLDTVTEESRLIDTTLKEWLAAMAPEERARLVHSFYETLMATGAKTLTELSMERVKLVKVWGTLDPTVRGFIVKLVSLMIKQGAHSVGHTKKYTVKKKE